MLTDAVRIAIWDRNRIIVAFATSIWGTNVAFLIQGKSISLPPAGDQELYSNVVWF